MVRKDNGILSQCSECHVYSCMRVQERRVVCNWINERPPESLQNEQGTFQVSRSILCRWKIESLHKERASLIRRIDLQYRRDKPG